MNYQIKYILFALINFVFSASGFSQTPATSTVSSDFNVSVNTTLCCIAVVLLFIIIMLARTVNQAIDFYKNNDENLKDKNRIKPLALLAGLMASSQIVFSQTSTAASSVADNSSQHMSGIYFYSFIVLVIVEIAIIFFLLKALRFLTGIDQQQKLTKKTKTGVSFWQKINQLKPIEEEASLDTGHSYDGIRELDNITPPWFTITFAASIVFAIIYLYRYEVAHTAPTQFEEYETEMREAKIMQDSMLKKEGNNIDENTVVMLGEADINAAKSIYATNCMACHGDKGQGGVGPNLADAYWIHGGSISEVFKSIKYGWAEKGMKPWKDDFSPRQIAQLSSYLETLKGTNPPNPKEKQGELYIEKSEATAMDTTSKK